MLSSKKVVDSLWKQGFLIRHKHENPENRTTEQKIQRTSCRNTNDCTAETKAFA